MSTTFMVGVENYTDIFVLRLSKKVFFEEYFFPPECLLYIRQWLTSVMALINTILMIVDKNVDHI